MKAQMNDTAALLHATKSVLGFAAGHNHHHHHHHHSKSDSGRVTKHKTSSTSSRDSSVTEEMQVYFSKLKELVPFMPRNRKLSKLEIIQYVIDYICDLQLALEAHPVASGGHVVNGNSGGGGGMSPVSPTNRQPLGVIANVSPNTSLTNNTCAAQEANHDKLPSHLEEVNTRPVSC